MSRVKGAALGGAIGAGGGWLLGKVVAPGAKWGLNKTVELARWGRSPKLTTTRLTSPLDPVAPAPTRATKDLADEVTELGKELRTGQTQAQRTPKTNTITGAADDVVEDGALFSMRELLGDPGAARKALEKRLGKITAVEAEHLANRIEKAMADGTQVDDPHFRSLMGFDIDDPDMDADTVRKAISIMEEGLDAVIDKANGARMSEQAMKMSATERLKQGLMMKDLEEAAERSRKGVADQMVSQHAELFAGVSFVRAKEKFMPLIRAGVEGSREGLAEALTKSAHIMAMSRAIGGNAGRALRARQIGGTGKVNEIADDIFEMESADAIRERVNASLKELGDRELADLLSRMKTVQDLDTINEVLTDAARAREWTAWQRTMNSMSDWLRSNALTPATGMFNGISLVAHDFFRNGLAKKWAARGLEKAGKADDALALRFEQEVEQRVYWEAHKRGVTAMLQRVDWEAWGAVEKIASVAGVKSMARKAKLMQTTMLRRGFEAPDLREYKPKPGIGVADIGRFEERLEARASNGGAFARLVNAVERVGAAGLTTLDEAGKASMKVFTGALDDYGRAFMSLKTTYALSARYAIREAMEEAGAFGSQKEMMDFAQQRAQQLADFPPSEILRKAEARLLDDGNLDAEPDLKFLLDRKKDVDLEAARTLLMDGPQTSAGRTFAAALRKIDKAAGLGQVEGVLLPYINTPIRILERGLVSYGPFAKQAEETLAILKRGGVEAEIETARMEMGMTGLKLGAMLGMMGGITVTNGHFTNSANLDAGPPNRINIPGGGFIEIGRLDPFALTLAMGALWGQAAYDGYHAYDEYGKVDEGMTAFAGTAFFGVQDAILSKSYLKQLQELTEIMSPKGDEEDAGNKAIKFLQGVFTRLVPVSGTSRQVTESVGGYSPEVITIGDAILRGLPGGSLYLSPRRDVLGDEVKGRFMGVAFGDSDNTEGEEISDTKRQLRELGIDLTNVSKTDGGIALSSEQVSELRRIRGKEALNAEGETMEEALQRLFEDPDFQAGDRDDRHDAVVDLMNDFNDDAKAILEERDEGYLGIREGNAAFREYKTMGLHNDEAKERAREDVKLQGLKAYL
jgi:hypothetical protein